MRWPTCCVPLCGKPSQAVYRRRERGPDGKLKSTKTRGLCGEHDFAMRKMLDEVWGLMDLRHPEAV
jgi:hypothetical protein